eukprot:UN2247
MRACSTSAWCMARSRGAPAKPLLRLSVSPRRRWSITGTSTLMLSRTPVRPRLHCSVVCTIRGHIVLPILIRPRARSPHARLRLLSVTPWAHVLRACLLAPHSPFVSTSGYVGADSHAAQ